jgi:acetaldehyde dehydrogenase
MSAKAAIIGSGNIGTDLMFKIMRLTDKLDMGVMVGIDPASDGLARAARLGIATTAEGVEGLIGMPEFEDIEVIFDATSAGPTGTTRGLAPTGRSWSTSPRPPSAPMSCPQ